MVDTFSLFNALTCGATFKSKRKYPLNCAKNGPAEDNKADIKKEIEIKEETDTECYSNYETPNSSDVEIKEESDVEDDKDGSVGGLRLFDDVPVQSHIKKKKKKPLTESRLMELKAEKINKLRKKYQIHVQGKNVPDPLDTFSEFKEIYRISPKIIDNLFSCGYTAPTPIQMQAVPVMSSGRSLMACAPTGSGKTAAFLLPIIRDLRKPKSKGFRAVILCPTRELAKQTQRECLRLVDDIGIRIHTLSKINQAEQRFGDKSNKKFDILISTPNRICYLLNQEPPVLDLENVKWLILDEADKLFEEGKNSFREQFDKIFTGCSHPRKKVALFSATWTNPVAKWCRKNLQDYLHVSIGQRNVATDLVEQELLFVGTEDGKLLAFRDLIRKGLNPPVLVFVDSKDRAQQLYTELLYDGINIDVIHSDRTQQQRDDVVQAFREGKVWVLICTEIIGRGIDFKGVNLVVNYDFPPSAISYIHRIGRTGRAGRQGKAITYFTQSDKIHLKSVAKIMKNSGCYVPEYMLAMKDHSKKALRKLEKEKEKREDISKRPKKFRKTAATLAAATAGKPLAGRKLKIGNGVKSKNSGPMLRKKRKSNDAASNDASKKKKKTN